MKKNIFVVISSQYFFKYVTLNSFKQLEKKYNVYYVFNEKKLNLKNIKEKNKIFYKLDKKSSVRSLYLLNFLRIANHSKCKTFKAVTEWYYPNYSAFKQMFKQDNLKSFYTSYFKIFFKKITMKLFSLKFLSNFMSNFLQKY